jgi:uridine phosphorylase
MSYPILEHDPIREAFIEPSRIYPKRDMPESCVVCFFRDVVDTVVVEHKAQVLLENRWEDGPHPIYEIQHRGQRLAFYQPGIGAPLATSLLEEVIAFGCRKFIACGGCGVLEEGVDLGHLVVVSSAVRDEGVSYHYLPPAREIKAEAMALQSLIGMLSQREIPYRVGKTWTTDAPCRETPDKIKKRRDEGCLVVEMEAAAMMAVAQFREVPFGQLLYAGDDLSGADWDHRNWQSQSEVREDLFWLAADAVQSLQG